MEKKTMPALTAALILLLLNIAYTCLVYFGKLQENMPMKWLSYAILIGGITVFVVKYGKDKEDNVSFGNLFAYGFKITAILALAYVAFMLILFTIFPEFKQQIMDVAESEAKKAQKGASAEDIQKGVDMFKKLFWVFMIGGIIFMFAITGCIGALIGAGIAKKNPRVFHEDSL